MTPLPAYTVFPSRCRFMAVAGPTRVSSVPGLSVNQSLQCPASSGLILFTGPIPFGASPCDLGRGEA